jgi:hypothetical protein
MGTLGLRYPLPTCTQTSTVLRKFEGEDAEDANLLAGHILLWIWPSRTRGDRKLSKFPKRSITTFQT